MLNGLLGSLGITAVIPLLSFVVNKTIEGAEPDPFSKLIIEGFTYLNWTPNLKTLLAIVVSLFIMKAIVLFIFYYVGGMINLQIETGIRR